MSSVTGTDGAPPGFASPKRPVQVRRDAVVNLWDFLVKGGIADTTRTPSEVIDVGRTRELHRYTKAKGVRAKGLPLLFIPPLGSQSACFDLRRGLSLAEDFVNRGRPTYLLDYGSMTFADRAMGFESWMDQILPTAIHAVLEDHAEAGDRADGVDLVGWSLGGTISLLTLAAHPDLPVASLTAFGTPIDYHRIPAMRPLILADQVLDRTMHLVRFDEAQGLELALEVGRPEVVRRGGAERNRAGVHDGAATPGPAKMRSLRSRNAPWALSAAGTFR